MQGFGWGSEWERTLQQIQTAVQGALLLGPSIQRCCNFRGIHGGKSGRELTRPRREITTVVVDFQSKAMPSEAKNHVTGKTAPGMLLGPGRNRLLH